METNRIALLFHRFCIAALVVLSSQLNQASAETELGSYKDWNAYTAQEDGKLVCYMGAVPKKSSGKYTKRGKTFLLITHRPKEKSINVVSLRAGYTYEKGSEVEMTIGKSTFKLFTTKQWAFAEGTSLDKALVNAMIRGSTLTAKGLSSRGNWTTDIYSLNGFTAAYKAIGKACKI